MNRHTDPVVFPAPRIFALNQFANLVGQGRERDLFSVRLAARQRFCKVYGLLCFHFRRQRRFEGIDHRLHDRRARDIQKFIQNVPALGRTLQEIDFLLLVDDEARQGALRFAWKKKADPSCGRWASSASPR